jgi:hypothetical protein
MVPHWIISHPFISTTLTQISDWASNGGGTLNTYGVELIVAIYTQLRTFESHTYTSYGEVPVNEFMVTCVDMFINSFLLDTWWTS